jgi:hypothetical protein
VVGVKEGAKKEKFLIGHSSKYSNTFIPLTYYDETLGFSVMDCPGFLDSRGTEISIANAVNLKNAIKMAKSIKVIILIEWAAFQAVRGNAVLEMLKITDCLFAKQQNLINYKNSILIGFTKMNEMNEKFDPQLVIDRLFSTHLSKLAELKDRSFFFCPF